MPDSQRDADSFTVSVVVATDPERAFSAFTEEIDLWWLRGPKHRFRAPWTDGMLRLQPEVGGSLSEHYPDGSSFTIGQVLDWQPGARLHLSWRLPGFASSEQTEVIVSFEPVSGGTRVSVSNYGWSSLRADHPALHGQDARHAAHVRGMLWAETLNALRRHLQPTTSGGTP